MDKFWAVNGQQPIFFSWMATNATYFMVFNFEIITFDDLTQGSHQVLFDA